MTDQPERRLATPKEPPPTIYKASLDRAQARTLKRQHGPVMEIDPATNVLASPFSEAEDEWRWMVIDTFGTRSHQVANVFLKHLVALCSTTWHETTSTWVPDEDELTAVLHIVAAYRPRNEAEAALAAQIAATHMITMKIAKRAYDYPFDTRTVSAYAKLARTSAIQIETMAGLKGRRRTTRQQIKVVHEKHIHRHEHVHVGGAENTEGQCHATRPRTTVRNLAGASAAEGCGTLPGNDPDGRVVPLQGRARQEGVSYAWRDEQGRADW